MEVIFGNENLIIFSQLFIAMILGMFIGAERSIAGKTAGMRTYGLVSMGSCLFIVVTTVIAQSIETINFDPLRTVAGVVTGIGFIGAGLIIIKGSEITGLTTAAGLWVAAGIGIAVGFKLYVISVFATVLTLVAFTIFWQIEERMKDISEKDTSNSE